MIPELFRIGSMSISPYGVLVATGFFLALWTAAYLGSRYEGVERRIIWDFGITTVLIALVGAKILMIVTDPFFYNDLSNVFSMNFVRSAGVFYGGFLAALGWAFWYFRRHGLPGWRVADAFAPAIPLGHALGRLGCFSAGCCHGRPTDSFLGIVFTDPRCMVDDSLLNVAIYPTQLMGFGANVAIFLLLFCLYRKKTFHGQMILAYAVMYATARFIIEFFRGDQRGWVLDGILSTSQFVALLVVPIALVLYFILKKKEKIHPENS